jgi:hypothetical protein
LDTQKKTRIDGIVRFDLHVDLIMAVECFCDQNPPFSVGPLLPYNGPVCNDPQASFSLTISERMPSPEGLPIEERSKSLERHPIEGDVFL